MRIVFMGTPDFAVDTLQCLIDSEHEVVGVVTQPDKAKGRSGKLQFTPVKEVAMANQIPVFQPDKIKDPEAVQYLRQWEADVIVVVAFGQILPKEILTLPKYGCLNVHASLLPKLRGAAPIQWSIINGDRYSGVTIMQMDEGLDTGDMLLVKEYELAPKETGGSLFDRLASFGGPMILEVLEAAMQGALSPIPQDHTKHTYAKMLSKETGRIDFEQSAIEIERLIRGLNPWPSAFAYLEQKMLKIWEADVVSTEEMEAEGVSQSAPGEIVAIHKQDFWVMTGEGCLKINEVQLAGKKRMDAGSFLRGYSLAVGTKLSTREMEA